MRRVLVVVVLLVACAACGSAAPVPPPQRTVDLTGVDPCTLVTADQQASLGVERQPSSHAGRSTFYGTEVFSCVLTIRSPEVAAQIVFVDNTGIERYDKPDLMVRTEQLAGRPFPTVLVRPTNSVDDCEVVISSGPGSLIDVYAAERSRKLPPASQQQLCDVAVRLADFVMGGLAR